MLAFRVLLVCSWLAVVAVQAQEDDYRDRARKYCRRTNPEQILDLGEVLHETKYYTRCSVVLENTDPLMGNTITMEVILGTTNPDVKQIAVMQFVRSEDGAVEIGGDFVPNFSTTAQIRLTITGPRNKKVKMTASLISIEQIVLREMYGWRSVAQEFIDAFRTDAISIDIVLDNGTYPDLNLVINQTQQSFPFGSAVDHWLYEEGAEQELMREFYYEVFNWGVTNNDMKWHIMEPEENQVEYVRVDSNLGKLQEHYIVNVTGHCLVWGKKDKVSDWIKEKTAEEINATLVRRVKELTSRYKGQFVQWDVNNENLHHRWFEKATGNPHITEDLFKLTHSLDPTATLFVNDYDIVDTGVYTSAMEQQIRTYQKRGIPVGGIGIQARLSEIPDLDLTWSRLDRLSKLGLPLWISALDVNNCDLDERAEIYEKSLMLFYSHPAVEGIVIWGLHSLLDNAQAQAAGKVVRRLLRDEWRTEEVASIDGSVRRGFRGFHGTYEAALRDGDRVLKKVVFELVKDREVDAFAEIRL